MATTSPLAAAYLAAAALHFAIAAFVVFSAPRRVSSWLVTLILALAGGSALGRAFHILEVGVSGPPSPAYLAAFDLEWALSFFVLGLALIYPRSVLPRGARGVVLGAGGVAVGALWLAVVLDKGLVYGPGLTPTWLSIVLDDGRYFAATFAALLLFSLAFLRRPADSPDRTAEYLFVAFALAPLSGVWPTLASRAIPAHFAASSPVDDARAVIGIVGSLAIAALYVGTFLVARRRGHRTTTLVGWGAFAVALALLPLLLPRDVEIGVGPFGEVLYLVVRPALVGYAILRHQLFDIDVRVKRGFAASVMIVAVAGVFLPIEETVRRFSGLPGDLALAAGIGVGLAVSLVLYARVQDAVQGATGRLFARVRENDGSYLFERKREIYRSVLERSLDTRLHLTRGSEDITRLRLDLGISEAEHDAILAQVRAAALAAPEPAGPAHPGTHLLGRYRVESVLGQGASGTTYRCHDTALGRAVAVKEIDLGAGPQAAELRRRAINEARRLASVRNDHVVTLLDVHEARAHAFLVMELVEGGSLGARLARGPLTPEEARATLAGILRGLAALHEAGIVHRDLKPSNVLLTPDGRAKLADLGVAQGGSGADTVTGLGPRGTPLYMAPEQVLGLPTDARTDVYAAGALLYELLAGAPLVRAMTRDGTLVQEAIVSNAPPLPIAGAPSWANAFLERALAKNPPARFASAREALDALLTTPVPVSGRAAPDTG